jgi:fumarate hydratase, class II
MGFRPRRDLPARSGPARQAHDLAEHLDGARGLHAGGHRDDERRREAARGVPDLQPHAAARWDGVVKIGRTHLEDAVPLTVGQEWSGYAHQLIPAIDRADTPSSGLYELAAGDTAVGTGLNAPPGFANRIAGQIARQAGYPFVTAANKFTTQGGLDAMVGAPGKVNPTQCEAMVVACIQVLADDSAIAFAGSQGNSELNAMRPVIINNFLHSATILADAGGKLRQYCIEGTQLHDAVGFDRIVNPSAMAGR